MGALTAQPRRALVAAATLCLALVAAGPASAATVSVEERPWTPDETPPSPLMATGSNNLATLVIGAAAGEQNRVTVREMARAGGLVDLEIVDASAALGAGAGCAGGGAPGVPVRCAMHAPRPAEQVYCGKNCVEYRPGTEWTAAIRATLGDGDDSFDAGAVGGPYPNQFSAQIDAGAGADAIVTGGGDDELDPGTGADSVHSGAGRDRVVATAEPDEPDLYDLGADGFDIVSYAPRSATVIATAAGGGAKDEGDRFAGVEFLIGGSATDSLTGTTAIVGGPGQDFLTGSEERNWIFGGSGDDRLSGRGGDDELDGEDGNDFFLGGDGDDRVRENPRVTEGDSLSLVGFGPGSTTGADRGSGGAGDDIIDLGPGEDEAHGDSGDDWLYGGEGEDRLNGGTGDDIVAGEAGEDEILGGNGADEIRAARVEEHWYTHPPQRSDTWRDFVDCGAGRDRAEVNPWDRDPLWETMGIMAPLFQWKATQQHCERRRTLPIVGVRRPKLNRLRGTARLPITVVGPGTLHLRGPGIKPRDVTLRDDAYTRQHPLVLTVAARGAALRALGQRGRVEVRAAITVATGEGPPRGRRVNVSLRAPTG